jgi:segregation and condensation protein B
MAEPQQQIAEIDDTVIMTETPDVPLEAAEDLAITQEDVRLVEAILFAAPQAIGVSQIAERFPAARARLIPDILDIIKSHYEGRGVNLVQRESKYALRTSSDLGDALRLEKEQPKKFTRAAMETMAVVAYHQPVTRAEIENIRGVATSPGALDALMEAGWIKPGKRREVPGRPVTWLTTQSFLDHFGLERLGDLPGLEDLKAAGLLDKRPAIEAMPQTGDLFGGDSENAKDELAQDITDEDLIGKAQADENLTDEEKAAFSESGEDTVSENEAETETETETETDEDDFDAEASDEDDEGLDEEDDDDDFDDEDDEEDEE